MRAHNSSFQPVQPYLPFGRSREQFGLQPSANTLDNLADAMEAKPVSQGNSLINCAYIPDSLSLQQDILKTLEASSIKQLELVHSGSSEAYFKEVYEAFHPACEVLKKTGLSKAGLAVYKQAIARTVPVIVSTGYDEGVKHAAQVSALMATMVAENPGFQDLSDTEQQLELLQAALVGLWHDSGKINDMKSSGFTGSMVSHNVVSQAVAKKLLEGPLKQALEVFLCANKTDFESFSTQTVKLLGINDDSNFVLNAGIIGLIQDSLEQGAERLSNFLRKRYKASGMGAALPFSEEHLALIQTMPDVDSGLDGHQGSRIRIPFLHLLQSSVDVGGPVAEALTVIDRLSLSPSKVIPNAKIPKGTPEDAIIPRIQSYLESMTDNSINDLKPGPMRDKGMNVFASVLYLMEEHANHWTTQQSFNWKHVVSNTEAFMALDSEEAKRTRIEQLKEKLTSEETYGTGKQLTQLKDYTDSLKPFYEQLMYQSPAFLGGRLAKSPMESVKAWLNQWVPALPW